MYISQCYGLDFLSPSSKTTALETQTEEVLREHEGYIDSEDFEESEVFAIAFPPSLPASGSEITTLSKAPSFTPDYPSLSSFQNQSELVPTQSQRSLYVFRQGHETFTSYPPS